MTETNPLEPYLVPVRRWWLIIVATIGLGLLAAWFTLPDQPEASTQVGEQLDPEVAFRATHILLQGRESSATSNLDLVVLLSRQGEIVNQVAEELGDTIRPGDLDAVELEADDKLGTLSVTAVQPSADLAGLVATTYAEAIATHFDARADAAVADQVDAVTNRLAAVDERIRDLEQRVAEHPEGSLDWRLAESELNVLVDQYGQLQSELRHLNARELAAGSTLETLQEPVPVSTLADTSPVFEVPSDSRARFGLAALIAAVIGVGLAIGFDRVDTRIRTREDAEEAFGLPVVAEIPRRSRRALEETPLPVHVEPESATAEAFRALRLSVQLTTRWRLQRQASANGNRPVGAAAPVASNGEQPRALVVTSSVTGEGKSNVVANLAASMAESGERVLVVDCDFRRSTIQLQLGKEFLGVRGGRTLGDLADPSMESFEPYVQRTGVPGVSVVCAGSGRTAPPWFLTETWVLVGMAKEMADVVIFDTGPLLATNEAAALTPHVDALLMVARSGVTSIDAARRATEQLTRLNAMVAGVVFVGDGATRTYNYYEPLRRSAAAREAMPR